MSTQLPPLINQFACKVDCFANMKINTTEMLSSFHNVVSHICALSAAAIEEDNHLTGDNGTLDHEDFAEDYDPLLF